MKFDKESVLWPILPFGGDSTETDSNTVVAEPTTNQPNQTVAQSNSTPESDSADDDDPHSGLSAKELRRLHRVKESHVGMN